jgi:hypothetical protein
MSNLTLSFAADIRPLFTDLDVRRMMFAFDLSSYDDVKANASAIFDRLSGIGGAVMPPPPNLGGDGPWPPANIDKFKQWMDQGFPA